MQAVIPHRYGEFGILDGTKYECRSGALTPSGVVTHQERMSDMSTIRIPLHSRKYPGLYALIDEADYELVSQYQWRPLKTGSTFYAVTDAPFQKMHRLILGATKGTLVDHANGDTLDNRRSNIRTATRADNNRNTGLPSNNSSGYKGVVLKGGRWCAQISYDGKVKHLGYFDTSMDAAAAYDRAAVEKFGPFALTNEMMGLIEPGEQRAMRRERRPSSGFPNVYVDSRTGKYWAHFSMNGRKVYVGSGFETAQQANDALRIEIAKAKEVTNDR